jgi:hypothetical protein
LIGLSAVEGDWVIRIEDVDWAVGKMRRRVDAYRPVYAKRGRGSERGRGKNREKGGARRESDYGRLK